MSICADISLDFATLRKAYEAGYSPVALIELIYARIAACNDPGIFISLCPKEGALQIAANLGAFDHAKPLYGMPFVIKDNIDLRGLPTTAACPTFAYTPTENAFAVSRLIEAGAIPVGKTNLDQFATGLVGVRTPFPIPRNAFDAGIVPGGSSSGSAVAVARGLASFALGTDTAGSGRVPAALNNIIGLKPSLGAISARGVVPACRTLDTISIFALTAEDAFEAFKVASAHDSQDAFSRVIRTGEMGALQPHVRLGIPDVPSRIFAGDRLAQASFDRAIEQAAKLGATPVEVDMTPFFETARLLYEGPWVAERYHAVRAQIEADPESLLPVTRQIIGGATRFSAVDVFDAQYKLAEMRRRTSPIWSSIDAMMVPTFPRPRTVADLDADPIGPNSELGTYTNFVNLLDLCGIAVPMPFRDDGFPSGITLLAPSGRDAFLAAVASAMHRAAGVTLGATGASLPARSSPPNASFPGEIEIAVVGAHLSGMALNGELTRLGARYVRSASTMPCYRLFALPGGPPFRPGLLRINGSGASIETEVWAMAPDAFATFVAGIPAPLGIGTLALRDGSAPKGFLVESFAVENAVDISHFLGWRAYIASLAA